MRSVDISFRRVPPPARWMWVATGLLWLAAAGTGFYAWLEQQKVVQLRAEILAMKMKAAEAAEPPPPAPPPYAESARQMLEQRTSAWPAALRALEQVQVSGVQIVGFDISTTEKRIRVELQFQDLGQILEYLHELNLGEPKPRWSLEQALQSGAAAGRYSAFIVGNLSP